MAENKKSLMLKETHNTLTKLIDSKMDAMPKGFNETRFLQNCMTVLQDTKDIEKCQPISVARTLLKGAFLGLDFFQKECYAIPYGNFLNFQTDYKGETKLCKKYSIRPIKDIYAKVVREGDVFEEAIMEGNQTINFNPISFNDEPIVGAFAVVMYQDGGMEYETMSTKKIEAIRNDFSKMKNGLMWTKTPEEGYKKTVLRRLVKKIEKDFETVEQAKEFNEASGMEFEKKKEDKSVPKQFDLSAQDVEYEQVDDNKETKVDAEPTDLTGSPFDTKGEK